MKSRVGFSKGKSRPLFMFRVLMYNKIMSRIRRFNFNKAFTLAEVLITLGIIGIVAAMTIPALMQNTQKQELRTGLKEAHSILSNAYNRLQSDQGFLGDYESLHTYYRTAPNNISQFATDFTGYLNIAQSCGLFGCINASGVGPNGIVYKDFGGTPLGTNINSYYIGAWQYILKNGMILFVWYPSATNGMVISVDVNGYKGPNTLGKDVFRFDINTTSNTVIPMNYVWGTPSVPCTNANANTNVFGCPSAALTNDAYWNLW